MTKQEIINKVDYCITMLTEIKKNLKELEHNPAYAPFKEGPIYRLSSRLKNALEYEGVIDMSPVEFCSEFTKKDVARFKNVGKTTVDELVKYVNNLGVNW